MEYVEEAGVGADADEKRAVEDDMVETAEETVEQLETETVVLVV